VRFDAAVWCKQLTYHCIGSQFIDRLVQAIELKERGPDRKRVGLVDTLERTREQAIDRVDQLLRSIVTDEFVLVQQADACQPCSGRLFVMCRHQLGNIACFGPLAQAIEHLYPNTKQPLAC
jgi:hypothetical protein